MFLINRFIEMKRILILLFVIGWPLTTIHGSEILLKPGNPLVHLFANQTLPGYAGVLPYIRDAKATTYVLLSREAIGKNKGKHCGFGGSNDYNGQTKKHDSFIRTAVKEVKEESNGLLKLSTDYVLTNSYIHFDFGIDAFYKMTAFTPLKSEEYKSAHMFRTLREASFMCYERFETQNCPNLEKDDFKWISLRSLLRETAGRHAENICVECLQDTIENPFEVDTSLMTQKVTIDLRLVFLETLIGFHPIFKEMEGFKE